MKKEFKKAIKKAWKRNTSNIGFMVSLLVELQELTKKDPSLAGQALEILDRFWFEFYLGKKFV